MPDDDILSGLNTAQREAATATEGPVLVFAGAGSGKTRTLTYRVAYMIQEREIDPARILAITFTNKATDEMRTRLSRLVPFAQPLITISTIHALCARILRRDCLPLGYSRSFTIIDVEDQLGVLKEVYEDHDIDKKLFPLKTLQKEISYTKALGMSKTEDPSHEDIFEWYQSRLKEEDLMDFEDLLLNVERLFRENPEVLARYQARFTYILVDEFQDTSTVQYKIVKMLALSNRNLFVVGDDDQSIYSFRGTDHANMQRLKKDFSEIKVFHLTENYRSTDEILKASNHLIANNADREPKELFSLRPKNGTDVVRLTPENEVEEAQEVLAKIRAILSATPQASIAVLYRATALSRNFEFALNKAKIPYKVYGGVPFLRRFEVKDMLSYLKLIAFGTDAYAFKRIVNSPKRGIGAKSAGVVASFMDRYHLSLDEAVIASATVLSHDKKTLLEKFATFIAEERTALFKEGTDLIAFFDDLVKTLDYKNYLDESFDNADDRFSNLEELKSMLATRMAESTTDMKDKLIAFFDEASLSATNDPRKEEEGAVVLSTIHSVKGLEFDDVFVVGLEEGVFPASSVYLTDEEMEEERRIAYVAFTRARDHLYLSSVGERMLYGRRERRAPSRFLLECFPKAKGTKTDTKPAGAFSDFDFSQEIERSRPKKEGGVRAEENGYKPGDTVVHDIFGEGLVLAISDGVLHVFFPEAKKMARIPVTFEKMHKKEDAK